jgi:hypothetical protein
MGDLFSGLKIKHWWQAVTVAGGIGMVASVGFGDMKPQIFLLSLGLLLFGIGQWINHPVQVGFGRGVKVTRYNRTTYPLGLFLEFLGGFIFLVEVYRVLFPKH